jgi:hypothetical protein
MRRNPGERAVDDAELSVDLLQRSYPQVLSTWVSVGVYASMVGYGASALGIYVEHSAAELLRRFDLWMVVCSLIALGLHRSGRAKAAGLMVIAPVWLEQHNTLATMPQQVWASPAAVLQPFTDHELLERIEEKLSRTRVAVAG